MDDQIEVSPVEVIEWYREHAQQLQDGIALRDILLKRKDAELADLHAEIADLRAQWPAEPDILAES